MKLMLRSFETKVTLRIEVPNSCSLQHLKAVILQRISSSSSIHLSLNRKDELHGSSQHTLQSLGIISGDLIFFTLNPNGFSSKTQIAQAHTPPQEPNSEHTQNSQKAPTTETNLQEERVSTTETLGKHETLDFESGDGEIKPEEDKNLGGSGTEYVLCYLRGVFGKEVVGDGRGGYRLLVIAVHAVLIESGFVRVDPVSKMILDGFNTEECSSSSFNLVLSYTLPQILCNGNGVETVSLKFVSLEKFIFIYGLPGSYQVYLHKEPLVSFLYVVWANCELFDETHGKDLFSGTYPEKEVFEFWKIVKDKIALPLLIDLCEKAGLAPPPCFMRLPTDLKLKILKSLAGVDLAKLGCVCLELLFLSSNDDLWKQKFVEQFGNVEGSKGDGHWKGKFAKCWECRKMSCPSRMGVRRDPNPSGVPGFIGGNYHHLPVLPVLAISPPPGQAFGHYDYLPSQHQHHRHLAEPFNIIQHHRISGFIVIWEDRVPYLGV
ncbi:F-box protein SKIP22-like [Cornus florida]|uniref:F-box protein SKIP22-like n=1 Tax=Cornus florida TaxID=4283 RepID=UPI00289C9442|nr:F-box protein SKIP22-like [Cornus florida]